MSNSDLRRGQIRLFAGIAVVGLVLDQVTKWLAVAKLTNAFSATGDRLEAVTWGEKLDRFLWLKHPLRVEGHEVFENFWHYRYVENPGAAWGFLADTPDWFRTPFFLVVTVVAIGLMIYFFLTSHPNARLFRVALALVMSGAVGNFMDRVRLGYVIDFIDWHWYQHHWPTFNIADSFISVGVALLMLDVLINGDLYEQTKVPSKSQEG